jgi:hypothetical protein
VDLQKEALYLQQFVIQVIKDLHRDKLVTAILKFETVPDHLIDDLLLQDIVMSAWESKTASGKSLLKDNDLARDLGGLRIYDITEKQIIKRWDLFTDEFRHIYRQQIYED